MMNQFNYRPLSFMLLGVLALPLLAQQQPGPDLSAELTKVLNTPGWSKLPKQIDAIRHSGIIPSPVGTQPPVWFLTYDINENTPPFWDAQREARFVASIEAAHAGKTQVIENGVVLLVDPQKRIWSVAAHMPHVLRCYDGAKWTYRRADGLPAAEDEPGAFAQLAIEGKLPKSHYAAGGLRDLNDLGRWYHVACADTAGNLHFVAGCNSTDAEARGAGGGGVYTLRPDGSWSFFRIYPADMPRSSMAFNGLRCVLHDPTIDLAEPKDLLTIAQFRFSDPVAEMHGHKVEPIPDSQDRLRFQDWKDRTDEPRHGPVYLLRYNGENWRFERSSIGWGSYDQVLFAWPRPDGRAYLANRFGLWVHWPEKVPPQRIDRFISEMFDGNEEKQEEIADKLASMGDLSIPVLEDALEDAQADRTRQRLTKALEQAEAIARGDADDVPVVNGLWRFFGVYPQATMPDGRFVFHCDRSQNISTNQEIADCLVFFDPKFDSFEVKPINRPQWNTTDFHDKRANEAPVKGSTVIDRDGGVWVPGGFRCNSDGNIKRLTPPGLGLRSPHLVDDDGRVYFYSESSREIYVYRDAPAQVAGAAADQPEQTNERQIHRVRGLFRQPEIAPQWSAWAIQERDNQPDLLLRLDGPEPTRVELHPDMKLVSAVVPLDGGCIASGPLNAGFWDGQKWDVAPDVRTLVHRHGDRIVRMASSRAYASDTSDVPHGNYFDHHLMVAGDNRGGLWIAEDRKERMLWHWDGHSFTDLVELLPFKPARKDDGAVMTAARGQALIVRMEQNNARPGGIWAIWRVTDEDLQKPRPIPQAASEPGLYTRLLAPLGPTTVFIDGLWADRDGWLWSPIFVEKNEVWVRYHDARQGMTPWPRTIWQSAFAQGAVGPVWALSARGLPLQPESPSVWAFVGPEGPEPQHYSRNEWVGTHIPGVKQESRIEVLHDGRVVLLHEEGISLLKLNKLAEGQQPKRPMHVLHGRTRGPRAPQQANWEIEEIARSRWEGPRNDFNRVAFDETGVWILPRTGPMIRAPLPKP